MTCILWVGEDSVHLRLLEASGAVRVERAASVEEACARRADALARGKTEPAWAGIAVDAAHYAAAMQAAELRDGLAEAVGFADTLAFAGPLPGAYAFCARVGGIVAAFREATGSLCRSDDGAVVGSGPEAWAGLAALTQLRVRRLVAHTEPFDAATPAVAHRLGIELATADAAAFTGVPMVYSARELAAIVNDDEKGLVVNETVALHTAAAQVRLLASKEPDLETMRNAMRSAL
ncbi:hypothetical protein HMPREF0972_01171 [Actinomyces sp. oral taxon 848 str. F0332]|nr:hypothetical protein HMPREF0972_01171 [Actinomyces sp. oral taxon 848 str. F0332]